MNETKEIVFDSAEERYDDDFWLEQGRKLVEESLPAAVEAAKELAKGAGLLKAVYLGILGFTDLVEKTDPTAWKLLFALPLVFWLVALYFALGAIMTRRLEIVLHSPDSIRETIDMIMIDKQLKVTWAFAMTTIGLLVALALIVLG